MAQVKSAEADRIAEHPPPEMRLFLLYGPDAGLVSERADRIAANSGVDLADPFSLVRLDADTAAQTGRLAEEAHTVAMFGGERLIRVSGVTRRNLAAAVKPVLDRPPADCRIIVEAGDLKRDSALRRQVEKSASALAIPCFADTAEEVGRLVTAAVKEAGLSIDDDARRMLVPLLGSDRRVSRAEIAKLLLYCQGRSRIAREDVLAIVGDSAATVVDEMVKAVLLGDFTALESHMDRLLAAGQTPDQLVGAALRQFQELQAMRYAADRDARTPAAIVAAWRPPVHFSRRDALAAALSSWQAPAIQAALVRLFAAVLACRENPALARPAAERTMLVLARLGRRSRS